MSADDHRDERLERAGLSAVPGKRLILIANPYLSFFTFIAIAILAHIVNVLHSFNFSAPSSLFLQFTAILIAFAIFRSFTGAVA